jgi:hypothetical protein
MEFAISSSCRGASPLISVVNGELRAQRPPLIMEFAPWEWRFMAPRIGVGASFPSMGKTFPEGPDGVGPHPDPSRAMRGPPSP